MNKNLLTFMSHNFCANCCGDEKKLDCDSRGITCVKLAGFLVGCNSYKAPIDEEELDELVMKKYPCKCHPDERYCDCCINPDLKEAYKAGLRAKEAMV